MTCSPIGAEPISLLGGPYFRIVVNYPIGGPRHFPETAGGPPNFTTFWGSGGSGYGGLAHFQPQQEPGRVFHPDMASHCEGESMQYMYNVHIYIYIHMQHTCIWIRYLCVCGCSQTTPSLFFAGRLRGSRCFSRCPEERPVTSDSSMSPTQSWCWIRGNGTELDEALC